MNRKLLILFVLFFQTIIFLESVNFEKLNGSDLLLGIGARQIALGGAGSLLKESPGSIYWNPALLASINDQELQIDLESPNQINNLILVLNSSKFKILSRKFTLGLSVINRLSIKGNSKEIWSGYAVHLLDLTMIDLSDFQGKIDSKTYDYRLAFALQLSEKLNLGVNLVRLS